MCMSMYHQQNTLQKWEVYLENPLRHQVDDLILSLADTLKDPNHVQKLLLQDHDLLHSRPSWDLTAPALAAQLALFYYYMEKAFPEHHWKMNAQTYLKTIAQASKIQPLETPALYGGICGVAYVLQHFQQDRAQRSLHNALIQVLRFNPLWSQPDIRAIAEYDIDVVTGITGVLCYLMGVPGPDEVLKQTYTQLLNQLLKIVEPGQVLGKERWLCLPGSIPSTMEREVFPQGRFNCGVAHGIPGILGLCSLLVLHGHQHPALKPTIVYLSNWLQEHCIDKERLNWPSAIPAELATSKEEWIKLPPARLGWCYGIPGITRTLWLAGCALKDKQLQQFALEAFKSIFTPSWKEGIQEISICHGISGVLQIALRFAQESKDPFITSKIPSLVEMILEQHDQQETFRFPHSHVDFLTGASGIALTLLSASQHITPHWDRLLLLS